MREVRSPGRPREFDEQATLTKIMEVFWAKGYEGTSISDLLTATGLRKGSLYAAFGDKREIYLKALALYDGTAIDHSVKLLTGEGPPEGRLSSFLDFPIDAVAQRRDRRGCFLCNASVDQALLDPETARSVQDSVARLERALEALLSELPYAPAGTAQRRAEARHLLAVYFGLYVLAKGGKSAEAIKEAKQAALRNLTL